MDLEHADRAALVAEHSEEIVRKSYELWGMLIQKIPYVPNMRMILSAGSPQEGWACLRKYYETRAGSKKAKLRRDWSNVKQAEGEMPREYLTRASVIRTKLESYETPMDDVEANHHIAAGLSSLYEVGTSILLATSSLSFAPRAFVQTLSAAFSDPARVS